MTEQLKKRRWKLVFTVITFGALIILAYISRHQITSTIDNLGKVNAYALLLMIPLEILNYHAQSKLYQGLFRVLGDRIRYRSLYGLALELNFVNNIFPSGGLSGFSYFSVRMKNGAGVSSAKATLVQLMKFIMMFISFQILLLIGVIILAVGGRANDFLLLIAGSLVTLLIIATVGIGYIVGSQQRINSFFRVVTSILNKAIHFFRPKHPETFRPDVVRSMFTELHENYLVLRKNMKTLRRPLLYSLLANITEVMTIYVVYIAFGHWVNPGAVIIAYAVANFAGFFSVLPGGVGIYEALMTAVLAAGGIPPGVSLPVTVMYRVLNMAIQLPPGYFLYQRALHADSGNVTDLPDKE